MLHADVKRNPDYPGGMAKGLQDRGLRTFSFVWRKT